MMHLLLDLTIRGGLLALAATIIVHAVHIRTARARHAVWTVVLIGMLSLPFWSAWGPQVEIPLPSSAPMQATPEASTTPSTATVGTGVLSGPSTPTDIATSSPSATLGVRWDVLALTIYALGACALLVRLLLGTVRVRRLLRGTAPHAGHLTSASCAAPITVGWFQPVVVLPPGYDEWPPGTLDAVLIHECEHARRRDPLVQWLALLNRAVFWFNPLVWWLERQLAALAEEACDNAVLSHGHSRGDYAGYLLAMARAVAQGGRRLHVVGNTLPGPSLARRLHRILNDQPRATESRARAGLALVLCAASSMFIAAGTATSGAQGAALPEFWLDEDEWHREVAPLMTAGESTAYGRLRTVAERDSFIADFWRRRDATPGTENEVRGEFERRIDHARTHLMNPQSFGVPGYETDRGRFYVTWGPPDTVAVSGPTEEWRYRFVPAMGSAVTLRFEPSTDFACSVRGGRYRIISPAPRARFEGKALGSGAAPAATTYPGGFVHLAFPIHASAASLRFRMRSQGGAETTVGEVRGPIDYIQGAVLETRRGGALEPILALVSQSGSARFFEADSYACTEQLPADIYTLSVETTLVNGTRRTDEVTFEIQ